MPENSASDYGWTAAQAAHLEHLDYLTPRILDWLQRVGARRVLDLGSGNGALCARLTARGYDVVGVECDEVGIQVAQQAHPDIPFYRFGVQDDPALLLQSEQPFDAVVSTEVIEHLFAPHLLPRYAAAVLKDKGYLLISTPYHGYLKNLAISLAGRWDHHHNPLWHGGHIKFWSRSTLTALLEQNGFRVIGFSGAGRLPGLWKSMLLVARKS